MIGPAQFAAFLYHWHGLPQRQSGPAGRRRVLSRLQGYAAPYSDLETRILPARLVDYQRGELDSLCQAGTLAWQGHERLSSSDGVVSLYQQDMLSRLARISGLLPGAVHAAVRAVLVEGACEFERIKAVLGGYPPQWLTALWDMVWAGEVSNQRLLPLQALQADQTGRRRPLADRRRRSSPGRRRFDAPVGSAGEWYLLAGPNNGFAPPEEREMALARQLLVRWGIVGQRCFVAEGGGSGFTRYERALQALQRDGEAVKGAYVRGLGATQFACRQALDRIDAGSNNARTWLLAASDPANPYGGVLPWPKAAIAARSPQRVAGARVILRGGELIGYLGARGHDLLTFPTLSAMSGAADSLIASLIGDARFGQPVFLRSVDGQAPGRSRLGAALRASGFTASRQGYVFRM